MVFVSHYEDSQLVLMKMKHLIRLKTETLQVFLRIKMYCSVAMFEECVPAIAKAWSVSVWVWCPGVACDSNSMSCVLQQAKLRNA